MNRVLVTAYVPGLPSFIRRGLGRRHIARRQSAELIGRQVSDPAFLVRQQIVRELRIQFRQLLVDCRIAIAFLAGQLRTVQLEAVVDEFQQPRLMRRQLNCLKSSCSALMRANSIAFCVIFEWYSASIGKTSPCGLPKSGDDRFDPQML